MVAGTDTAKNVQTTYAFQPVFFLGMTDSPPDGGEERIASTIPGMCAGVPAPYIDFCARAVSGKKEADIVSASLFSFPQGESQTDQLIRVNE
jgi:hypothetical protein